MSDLQDHNSQTTEAEVYCHVCQSVRMSHCSDPENCGNVKPLSDKMSEASRDETTDAGDITFAVPMSASFSLRASGWQPIETAPRDGTAILAWIGDYTVAWWKNGYWCDVDMTVEPTYWMPLPGPPGESA